MKIKLFHYDLSDNSYKIRLVFSLFDVKYEIVIVDLIKGENKSPEFSRLNPFGQVPVLIDDENVVLQDSQAILIYLARKYADEHWLPRDAEALSHIVYWLSVNAEEISQGVRAASLFYLLNRTNINIEIATQKYAFILQQIEQHIIEREWLELDLPTIDYIAVVPYVALAPDGKIALDSYPHIQTWIDRFKQLSGFVGMRGI